MSTLLQGGRLPIRTRKEVVDFISSRENDRRIYRSILLVNEAHVAALLKARVINSIEAKKLTKELAMMESRSPMLDAEEDLHLYVEQRLSRKLGPDLGGKLHTGKSRNDQVATAIRLTLRESLLDLSIAIMDTVSRLLSESGRHKSTFFVGYTHAQPAQPITYGHYLLSLVDFLMRDNERVVDAYHRVNLSPMGSAALAGSSFKLDRRLISRLLGFEGLIENSLDGVESRDFLLETLSACSLTAIDISRIAQDMIFFGSSDVRLVDLPASYSSTSSIMPQKKNPDPLEIIRARCGKVIGNFNSATIILHSLPSGYNLDFQEVTPLVWDSIDTLQSSLAILTGLIAKTSPSQEAEHRYQVQFTAATELANMLVRELDLPFRTAHRLVGNAVQTALRKHQTLKELDMGEWTRILGRELTAKDYAKIRMIAEPRASLRTYRTEGSPNPNEVEKMIVSRKRSVKRMMNLTDELRTLAYIKRTL